jgi:hypothetical protein
LVHAAIIATSAAMKQPVGRVPVNSALQPGSLSVRFAPKMTEPLRHREMAQGQQQKSSVGNTMEIIPACSGTYF